MKNVFHLFIVPILVMNFAGPSNGQVNTTAKGKLKLDDIYAPVFVATPPENAFNGLVQLSNGELRHYGFKGPQAKPTSYYYIFSKNNGLTWDENGIEVTGNAITNEDITPFVQSPYSGHYIRLKSNREATYVLRSENGPDGEYDEKKICEGGFSELRHPIFLQKRHRIIVATQQFWEEDEWEVGQSCVLYSDDDGQNWKVARVPVGPRNVKIWPDVKFRWQNYAIEPTIIELKDGRLWMLMRTSTNNLYESFSEDAGTTWNELVPSRFYSTLTMPTLFRLKDDRMILFWCNTTPLPEVDRSNDTTLRPEKRNGLWEDVFTNRDALHAAISEDDGKTWIGFRELYLNPLRNEKDWATRGGTEVSLDRSVHQAQAVELPHGKVLVALGQHPLVRAMIIFDPDWLYETKRSDDFKTGLKNWSTFKYVEGIKGHCAYNRDSGTQLVDDPLKKGRKFLCIRHPKNPNLVCDIDGAVWNFPAGRKGSFTTNIFLKRSGMGGRIYLMDRWFNPTDTMAYRYAAYNLSFSGKGMVGNDALLQPGKWHELRFEWDDSNSKACRLFIDGKLPSPSLQLNRPSENGICYVHFQSTADREDNNGFLIGSVAAHNEH